MPTSIAFVRRSRYNIIRLPNAGLLNAGQSSFPVLPSQKTVYHEFELMFEFFEVHDDRLSFSRVPVMLSLVSVRTL